VIIKPNIEVTSPMHYLHKNFLSYNSWHHAYI